MDWTDGGKCLPSDNKEQRAESARIQKTLARVITIQQAQFALLDELAQVVLRCMPEPPTARQEQASALAKKRHERLLYNDGGTAHARQCAADAGGISWP